MITFAIDDQQTHHAWNHGQFKADSGDEVVNECWMVRRVEFISSLVVDTSHQDTSVNVLTSEDKDKKTNGRGRCLQAF